MVRTLDCHALTSLRQTEVETTLTRISRGPGGATSTSSITSGCPGPHATAAARKPYNFTPRYKQLVYRARAIRQKNKSPREVGQGGLVPRQVMAAGGDENAASAAIPADPRRTAGERLLS